MCHMVSPEVLDQSFDIGMQPPLYALLRGLLLGCSVTCIHPRTCSSCDIWNRSHLLIWLGRSDDEQGLGIFHLPNPPSLIKQEFIRVLGVRVLATLQWIWPWVSQKVLRLLSMNNGFACASLTRRLGTKFLKLNEGWWFPATFYWRGPTLGQHSSNLGKASPLSRCFRVYALISKVPMNSLSLRFDIGGKMHLHEFLRWLFGFLECLRNIFLAEGCSLALLSSCFYFIKVWWEWLRMPSSENLSVESCR